MASDVQFTQPSDAPKLADVFFAAFSDRFNRTMFPDKPDVRVWIKKNMLCGEGISEDQIMLKVTDPSNSDVVAAFAKWVRPSSGSSADHNPQAENPAVWPESSDGELCDRFFGTMDEHHKDAMMGRPHYYLEILAVHPSYQGRGLASKLLRWGLARADEEGVEVYLSSSPDGRPLYEKYGFQVLDRRFSPFPGYEQVDMIRPVQHK